MELTRSCGILLHPTALPNKYGIGDMGPEAYKFIDFLAQMKQKYWQILPLTIAVKGNSPYSPISSFAGNPLLISPELLIQDNLLQVQDIENILSYSSTINFSELQQERDTLLELAYHKFSPEDSDYISFCQNSWLDDFALFITLYEKNASLPWNLWQEDERTPSLEKKKELNSLYMKEINFHKFKQFIFYQQWMKLKTYANDKSIQIIGDIPIYVSFNSADVWAHKELFQLASNLQAEYISGCPPDNFNPDGQIWENPLYNWQRNKDTNYHWWIERIAYNLKICDVLRLDHFIGFARYWSIPAETYDAKQGVWEKGPASDFFSKLKTSLTNFNIVAEDLGSLTEEVIELRNEFNFPGMMVLQYALEDWNFNNSDYSERTFVYTGTHDNNTTLGWWKDYAFKNNLVNDNIRNFLISKGNSEMREINNDSISLDLIEIAYATKCLVAIIPIQDMMHLDDNYRMNRPGIANGNWNIRLPRNYQDYIAKDKISFLMDKYQRNC